MVKAPGESSNDSTAHSYESAQTIDADYFAENLLWKNGLFVNLWQRIAPCDQRAVRIDDPVGYRPPVITTKSYTVSTSYVACIH